MEPQILELRNLKAQRDALDKQIEEASKKAREDALNICRELIKEYDFAPQELGLKKAMKRANSIAPKLLDPMVKLGPAEAESHCGCSKPKRKERPQKTSGFFRIHLNLEALRNRKEPHGSFLFS